MGARMVAGNNLDLELLARRFPDVERLTCSQMAVEPQTWNIDCLIKDLFSSYPNMDKRGKPEIKINTIAMFTENHQDFDASRLRDILLELRQYGHQLCTIMLPKHMWDQANDEQILELKKLIEVKEFLVDWLMLFERVEPSLVYAGSVLTEGSGREY